jgi:hypothetical protein
VEGHTHGRTISERLDGPAWSQTLACAEASCTGTGRSHGRPAALGQLGAVEKAIAQAIDNDSDLRRKRDLLLSISGVVPEAPAVTNTRCAIFVSPVFVVFCAAAANLVGRPGLHHYELSRPPFFISSVKRATSFA